MEMERNADWLAAFAVGLTYSTRPVLDLVTELQLAAGARPELLDQARTRLRDLPTADATVCSRAATLLAVAAGSVAALG